MKKKKVNIKKDGLKISEDDRIQGLIRNKQFLEDLKKTIFSFKNKPEQKGFHIRNINTLEKKYKITIPPSIFYNALGECIEEIKNYYTLYSENEEAVRPIPTEDSNLQNIEVTNNVRKKLFPKAGKRDRVLISESKKHPFIKDGRYLTLKIDLTKKKKDIMRGVERYVELLSKIVEKPEGKKSKKLICSPWDVYDMHNKDKLRFSQIARKLSGEGGSTSYVYNLKLWYKKVKRAYNRASQIIELSSSL